MIFLVFVPVLVLSYNNGVGKFPVMGFNTWNQFNCNVSEKLILEIADGLVKYGLDKVGYQYVNIDDCWQLTSRDEVTGKLVADPEKFPSGIDGLAEKIHSMGLKLGIYTDIGKKTCQKRMGSKDHYQIDAQTFAEWGIDLVKCDFCNIDWEIFKEPKKFYSNFSTQLNKTGRHMVFSICNWGATEPHLWAPAIANMWRTTEDISDSFTSVQLVTSINRKLYEFAGLYNYNDPDMLEVGVEVKGKGLTNEENRSHFSLWCMMASPLILGNDVREIKEDVLSIISNEEAIAINQDELGTQGKVMIERTESLDHSFYCLGVGEKCMWVQVWKKELMDGSFAILVFNHASLAELGDRGFRETEVISFTWKEVGIPEGKYTVRDLWERKDLGVFEASFTTDEIPQHSVVLLRFRKE